MRNSIAHHTLPPKAARLARRAGLLLAAALASLTPSWVLAQAGDAVVAKKAVVLRDKPGDTAASLGNIAAQTALTRLPTRQGAWVQVRTQQGQTGWLHMFDVGPSNSAALQASGGAGASRSVAGLFSPGGAQTTGTSTVGVRGLGAEDIANATPNPQAVQQAERMRANTDQARQFAVASKVRAYQVPPLPAPGFFAGGAGSAPAASSSGEAGSAAPAPAAPAAANRAAAPAPAASRPAAPAPAPAPQASGGGLGGVLGNVFTGKPGVSVPAGSDPSREGTAP